MTCAKHHDKEAAGMCVYCGKPYCKECLVEVNGKNYCRDDIGKVFDEQQKQTQTQQTQSYQVPPIIINNQNTNNNTNNNAGPYGGYLYKSKTTALILCLLGLLGFCGLHRFYVGKIGTGLIWLLTLGFFGIGQIVDFLLIISGSFRDKAGFPLV